MVAAVEHHEMCFFVCWLVGCLTSQQHASVSHGRICSDTLRQKLQIQLSVSPSHRILTPGQPAPALTLQHQAPGRVATGVPIFKSQVGLDPGKIPAQAGETETDRRKTDQRQTERKRERERQTDRQRQIRERRIRDRQTERKRETDRQTDKQTDHVPPHTHTHTTATITQKK